MNDLQAIREGIDKILDGMKPTGSYTIRGSTSEHAALNEVVEALVRAREAMREYCNELCKVGPAKDCESECCRFHAFVGKKSNTD